MKKDTENRPGVRSQNASAAPIGDPRPSTPAVRRETTAQVTISAKYIDSRLKQFCLR
jgi:hypothetical protein